MWAAISLGNDSFVEHSWIRHKNLAVSQMHLFKSRSDMNKLHQCMINLSHRDY